MSVAARVTLDVGIKAMLASINFDNEMMAHAHEVDDEPIARRLPAKMKATLPP